MKYIHRHSNDLTINQGWNLVTQRYLREYDNPQKIQTQIFAYSEQEDEEPIQDSTLWCKSCNQYTLEYVDALDAYFCTQCATKTMAEDPINHA